MEQNLITTSGLLEILLNIDELSEYPIDVQETTDGNISITIGNSSYVAVTSESAITMNATPEDADLISELNEEVYEEIVEEYSDNNVDLDDYNPNMPEDTVESGLLKDIAKTFLLGGAIKLAKKLLD